jgi:antitoxin component YwqK of YwqJK toxin-antitoxin module
MQGEFVVYYPNGKVSVRGTYLDGERHGKITNYGEKGEVAMIRNYNRGVIESYSYLGTDGKEVTPIPLAGNEMKIVANYKNGKKSMEQRRVNGLLEGAYIAYHENGQKSEESNFQYGEYHGKATEYSETGVKTIETDYEKGYKHGWEITYHSNGKVKSKVPFVYGNRHGVATYYSADGKLISTITYFNDETLEIK